MAAKSTKSFLMAVLAFTLGAYLGVVVLPAILPPSKIVPGG